MVSVVLAALVCMWPGELGVRVCRAGLPRGLHQDVEVECGAAQQGQGGDCAQVPAVGGQADAGLGLLLRLTPVAQPRHTLKCNIHISDSKIIFALRALYPVSSWRQLV